MEAEQPRERLRQSSESVQAPESHVAPLGDVGKVHILHVTTW